MNKVANFAKNGFRLLTSGRVLKAATLASTAALGACTVTAGIHTSGYHDGHGYHGYHGHHGHHHPSYYDSYTQYYDDHHGYHYSYHGGQRCVLDISSVSNKGAARLRICPRPN